MHFKERWRGRSGFNMPLKREGGLKGLSPQDHAGFSVVYTNRPGGKKLNKFSILAFWASPMERSPGQSGRRQRSSDTWASSAPAPWNTQSTHLAAHHRK